MKKLLPLTIILFTIYLPGKERTIPLQIKGSTFTVEIADSEQKRQKGLMFRTSLSKNGGMLFVNEKEDYYSFWMKNCKINLDIIFISKDKRVIGIFENVPPCKLDPCTSYRTSKPAMYILELRGGRASQIKLKKGDLIHFKLN